MSLAMRPNEVNTEVQYDCKVRHQAAIFLYTEVQNMRKNMTEIVFILDRSGSMSGLETDTIGGFNSMIEKQKKENGEALISTVLFDNVSEVMQDLENNAEVWCVMLELVQEIGTKLRAHKKKAGGIAISIRNNELFTKEWQCRISIPTQSPTYLAKTAFSLFAKNYQWEHPIRSMTVRAINLFEEDCPIQYDLFTDVKSLDRQERLDAAIEQIRFRFGKDAIKNGVLFQKSKMPTERKVDLVMPTGMIG